MYTVSILNNIARHIRLDEEEQAYFLSLLEEKELRKKALLLREGDICRYDYFVVKGCFKSYSLNEKGQENIVQFAPENWWTGDLYSFLTGQPTKFYVEAIEDSITIQISKTNLQLLFDKVPKFERFFRILFQNALIAQIQRVDDTLSKSAEEKYQQFLSKYPQLVNRLPQKLIASYIGVTPEFFSALLRKMKQ
ncbi:Crp/Fnr family transcriptional regulator [Flavihumibacter rivuli]|uniref:Crp/Fnr family transcriptional regulator n=1 Tax=Flavihumibacter rivuli TaxID=2838156 RepID=UPI001BDEB819|nr:Crp/Fnr family transcriptional regulator [Flavihumibacter rivuli]ULQ55661.1 Crp/Fnr family transcriptional regulator [Flavihumibacter rivuli]